MPILLHNWPDRWFKPRSWEDAAKLMDGYDTQLDEPIPGVSRLLVNVDTPREGEGILLAVQRLIYCEDDRLVDLDEFWKRNVAYTRGSECEDDTQPSSSSNSTEKQIIGFGKHRQKLDRFCRGGHYIAIFEEQGPDYETNCGVCEEPVLGPAYACNGCRLAIHKSCAEMEPNNRSFTPRNFQAAIIIQKKPSTEPFEIYSYSYSFPETHACFRCTEEGRSYDSQCSSCIFESFLKCRLIPTIIEHHVHHHKLSLGAGKITQLPAYKCAACGLGGNSVAYRCTGCDDIIYHAECALLPYPMMHKHGGREHQLELKFCREKDLEDYFCDFCLELMNPEDWYYYCHQCPQTYHLRCAFDDDNS